MNNYQNLVDEFESTKLQLEVSLENQRRQQHIIDNSDAGYFLIDREGTFKQVNTAWLRMHKYEHVHEVIGKHFSLTQVGTDLANAQLTVEALLGGHKCISGEFSRLCKDGSVGWHTFSARPTEQDGVIDGLEGFLIDISERKKVEETVRKNDILHSSMIANIGDVIGIIGSDGRMKYKSPNIERWFGWKPEDLIGTDGWNTVHHDDLNRIQSVFMQLLEKENASATVEYRYKCKNNTYTWIELTAVNRIHDPAIDGVLLNYHDITERKLTEERLRASECNYRSLFANMITACALHEIVTDEQGMPVDYIFLEANEAFEVMTGLKSVHISGKRVTEVLPGIERDSGDWIGKYGKVALTGESFSFEQYFEPFNKWYSVLAYAPVKNHFVTLFFDISDRKLSEQAIAAEKERLAVTLRSIGDGVITTDTHGNIELLNRAAEKLTGWLSNEATGHPLPEVFNIINEITGVQCENPVEKVLATGEVVELTNHTCLISKTGQHIIIADSGAPIRDKEGCITGVVLVFRDMTEKQKLNDSMQRAQKLESLGTLAGGIAHDFNNLLGGIFGYIDMVKGSIDRGNIDGAFRNLNKATSVFDRAKALTQQLLTFSSGGAPIRKTMQLGTFIRKSTLFALSGSNVACEIDIAYDLWSCDCDENQIGQVIDNVVINAKQAMAMGGKIIVKAQNVHRRHGGISSSATEGNFVKLSITDFGIGMPKEIISKIFDPFFSTKESGHGLGLATVFSIVQRHDGWIDIDSEPGKGSTFHLFIPASQKDAASELCIKRTEHQGRGTILIMDDEEFMLEIVEDMLVSMGYSIIKAENGDEALRLFVEAEIAGTSFVASILDLTIPGGRGGKSVAMEIRKKRKDAILIAASGYSDDPVIAMPTENGFTASIIKPFKRDELGRLLELQLVKSDS